MNDQNRRRARLRHTATGALVALAAVGAIASTVAKGGPIKTPTSTPQAPASPQPFLNAVERLVHDGTITGKQGQAVDRLLRQGYFDSSALTWFTQAQIQAVEQAITNTKRALA